MRPFLLPATHVIRRWIVLGIVATALQNVCGLAPSSSTPWETEADGSQVRNVTLAFGANNEHLHVCYERISPSGGHTGGCTQVMKAPPTTYNYSSGSGVVTTLAGSGTAGSADGTGAAARFNVPYGVAIAPDGSTALVADMDNSRIRSIALATGEVTTIAGGGYSDATGTATYFDLPFSVAITPDGSSALVTDTNNHLIRSIVLATSVVTTLAGSGSAGFVDGTGAAASFNRPIGIAITPDGSSALVIDHDNNAIRSIAIPVLP